MRATLLAALIASLGAKAAFAEVGALTPGKPAGIRNAQIARDPAIAIGISLIGAGIVIAATSNRSAVTISTTTTVTTATTP
jgi:hypothetical protein